MADGLRHTKILSHQGPARVAKSCQHEAAPKAGTVMRRGVGRVQMQRR